jgi:F-type H+-transporting ATPase subunit a
MEAISFLPEYIDIFWLQISQTLIASVIGTALFTVFIIIYSLLKKRNPHNGFVNLIDMWIEEIMKFFQDIWWDNISLKLIKIVVFVFLYILRSNIWWLMWDLFVLVTPSFEWYFRPVSTDLFFNLTLAIVCVIGSIIFGFQKNGFRYIEKYIAYKGIGIVPKVDSIGSFIWKIFDIIIWLFIGLIEFVWELARMLSLSLRLFWNILAGMVLLWLIVWATINFIKIPALLPLLVVFFELFVWFLQAFVFSMLVLVYFKMAWESHHD